MKTEIKPCRCKHAYQDQQYGPGNRVHNHAPGNRTKRDLYRCTVCQAEKDEK